MNGERRAVDEAARHQLEAIASLKVGQIERWRKERLRDAGIALATAEQMPALRNVLAGRASSAERDQTKRWLEAFRKIGAYGWISLVNPEGVPLLTAGNPPRVDCAEVQRALGGAQEPFVRLLDFHRSGEEDPGHLDVLAPFAIEGRKIAAAFVLAVDPRDFLYAHIKEWPVPSETGELLLVRREGDAVLYLNDLRHQADAALTLRLPLIRTDVSAVRGALGFQGTFDGLDYRGVRVLAAARPVPESGWTVIAKVDRAEIDALWHEEIVLVSFLAAALILAAASSMRYFWRRQRERYLRQFLDIAEELGLLADVIKASVNEIYVFDAETLQFRFVNQGAINNLGYTQEEMQQLTPLDLKPEISAEEFERLLEPLRSGQRAVQVFETVHRRKNGTVYPVEVHLQLVARGEGRVFLAVILNIEEKREMQAQLEEAQKLESVGLLAGGVAHDFNNYLTVINGFAELLLADLPAGAPAGQRLGMIRQAGEQAASLTRQLLAFSRRQVFEIQLLNLNDVVGELLPMLKRLVREDIAFVTATDPELAPVRADRSQMNQVIMNLVLNARDAIPQSGRIVVETANVEVDDSWASRRPGLAPGGYVMLSVSDTGAGMGPEVLSRIFEPFYTTKTQGRGTGLGLAATYGIVRQTGGWIYVYSEPGQGTTFKVYLPRAVSAEVPKQTGTDADGASRRGTETILVVEDQEQVRALTSHALREHGYEVLAAANGEEAEKLFRENADRILLLVTDVVMPGMSGSELSRRLQAVSPSLKTVFVSGYTSNVIVHQGVLDPGVVYLPKPFTPQALAAKVRQALDQGGSGDGS